MDSDDELVDANATALWEGLKLQPELFEITVETLISYSEATNALVSSQNPQDLLQTAVERTRNAAGAAWVRLVLIDERGVKQNFVSAGTDAPLDVGVIRPDGITMTVIRSGNAVVIENTFDQKTVVNPIVFEENCAAALCMPLSLHGRRIGVVWIHYTEPRVFHELQVKSLQSYVDHVAIAYERARRIEELEKFHDLEELDRRKTEFLATVTHELRSPLTHVIACMENLLIDNYGPLTETQRDRIEIALASLWDETRLIETLLNLASIQSGLFTLEVRPTNILDLIDTVLPFFRYDLELKNLEVVRELPRSNLRAVLIDPIKITNVLKNLIDNAIKFTPEGGTITIRVRERIDGFVEIQVADTGIGVPPEELPRVFERFHQIPNSLTPASSGTGVGLHVAREFVRLHGGEISVKSQINGGSQFSFTLPKATETSP